MSDFISRQAAIDAICKVCSMEGDYHKCDGYPEASTWCDYLVALRALPSAQPERKKGHWIEVDDHYNRISGRCSVCGWESHMYEDDVVGMDFCPNCGARLQEGEENG